MLSIHCRQVQIRLLYVRFGVSGMFRRPRIHVACAPDAANPLSSVDMRTKLATEISDMKIDAAIERGKLSAKNTLDQLLARKYLTRRFEKHMQQIKFRRG
jgi:hypothetical protein